MAVVDAAPISTSMPPFRRSHLSLRNFRRSLSTTLRRLSEYDFDRLSEHGYKVAARFDAQFACSRCKWICSRDATRVLTYG
jgi:hypothetical protein